MRMTAAVGLIGAGLVLAGCGSDGDTGDANSARDPVFSPCDDIPDDVLRSVGVDPSTESRDIMGVAQPGWKICGWRGSNYSLAVFATTRTLDDVRVNDRNEDFISVEVDGRSAFSYRETADSNRESCDVALDSSGGAVLVSVGFHVLTPPSYAGEPCEIAIQAARAVSQYVPK